MKTFALVFLFAWTFSLGADQIVETFSTRANLETAAPFAPSAVWNQTLGKIHPSLEVYGTGGVPIPVTAFDIGDGSDGVFDSSTYSHFGTINANKIQFDTSAHPVLQVTSFYLEPGWILEPVGSAPLLIKSQATVKIEGEIWCHGDDGQDATVATAGFGGQGRCGGTKGGDGGATVGDAGTNGGLGSDGLTGGGGGDYGTGSGGGGGGGRNCGGDPTCSTVLPGDGSNASTGGLHGIPIFDPFFLTLGGGAGGGGGGAGPSGEPGGGGGAGGGAVRIYAGGDFSIGAPSGTADGYIFANGGHGGNGHIAGGPGGGGGGGSVQVFAAGTIYLNNTLATGGSQANFGAGGTNTSAAYGGDGGDGRSWFTSIDYQSPNGSFYAPGEEAPVQPGNFVFYSTASQSVTTKVFDLQSSFPHIDSVTLSPASADYSIEYRASSDGFISDDTGWTANVSLVQNKRYLRLRILVSTSAPLAPVMLDSVTLNYTPGVLHDFSFKAAGCGRIDSPSASPPLGFLLVLLLFAVPLAYLKIKARQ